MNIGGKHSNLIRASILLALFVLPFTKTVTALAQEHKSSGVTPLSTAEEFEENKAAGREQYFLDILQSGSEKDLQKAYLKGLAEFRGMDNSAAFKQQIGAAWQPLSGSQDLHVSGRASSIAFDPNNGNILYLCSPQGGLWKSSNKGSSWVSLSDNWPILAMGAVAVDPNNSKIIYAGTGDIDAVGGGVVVVGGVGILKSSDGGLNWTSIASIANVGNYTKQVIVDKNNSQSIFHTGANGLTHSSDGGATWQRLVNVGGLTTMAMDPTNSDNLLLGGAGKLRHSTDGGATWVVVGANLTSFGRATVAIAASNPQRMYASLALSNGNTGVARSNDGGVTWTLVYNADQNSGYLGQQGWYANAFVVSPTNPDIVLGGGLDVWRSNNGGTSFIKKSEWTTESGASNYTHADVHELVYGPDGLYCLSDGGVFRSGTTGDSWTQDLNKGLSLLQFMGVDSDPDMTFVIGGAQDNGVNRAKIGATNYNQVLGGDGGRTYVSQSDGGMYVYSTYIQADLEKSNDGGTSWEFGSTGTHNIITNSSLLSENLPFYMNYAVSEADPNFVAIAGSNRVYYSNVGGEDGFLPISKSGQISSGPIAVHIAKSDPTYIYASSHSGYVFMSSDEGTTWKKSTTNIGSAFAMTTDIQNPGHVYACISGFGGNIKHFWVSTDYGLTWSSPATNLPDLSCTAIATDSRGDIFIGTNLGVMGSNDNGVTWIGLKNGMPLVTINSLQVRGHDKYLLAGTFGRGAFRLDLTDFPTLTGVHTQASALALDAPTLDNIHPNPIDLTASHSAKTSFSIPSEGAVRLSIYDMLGKEQRVVLNEYLTRGRYDRVIDLSNLSNGEYFYVLTASGRTVSQKIIVTR
jgi:hypothetical protein